GSLGGASGRGATRPPSGSSGTKRSETMTPFTASTGQVTYHPTALTRRRPRLAIVHSVSARRRLLVTGTSLWSADAAMKPRMPCCSGLLPVAIVVQIAGETVGSIERGLRLQ